MAKPITTPIVADLPENWTNGQTVAANGADAGLSQQHGYNYLNSKVNEALEDISVLNDHAGTAYTTTNKPTASDVGAVPTTRTVNSKALSSNISLTASDVSAVPNTTAGVNAAINLLSLGSDTPKANDYYISQYVSGGSTTTTYHRRPVSALATYVRSTITAGDISAGTVKGRIQGNATAMTTVGNMQFRDTALVSTDTAPSANGTINWTYE